MFQTVSSGHFMILLIVLVLLCSGLCVDIVQSMVPPNRATNGNSGIAPSFPLSMIYSTSDIYKLLNDKKQHLNQVNTALVENSILLDAFEWSKNKSTIPSTLHNSYASDKKASISELKELKSLLTDEISNIRGFYQSKPSSERTKIEANFKVAETSQKDCSALLKSVEKIVKEQEKKLKEEEDKKAKEIKEAEALKEQEEIILSLTKESKLLTAKQSSRFVKEVMKNVPLTCNSNSRTKLTGIRSRYRASNHGFSNEAFHSKCDGTGATVVLIKSTSGAVFGGYSLVGWNSTGPGAYASDRSAFIFSLISSKKEERFIKLTQENGFNYKESRKNKNKGYKEYAFSKVNGKDYGITFGGGNDLRISNNSNTNTDSVSNLCFDYCDTTMSYNTTISNDYLAGTYKFQVEEIEVYTY